jgi:hypothetical protein
VWEKDEASEHDEDEESVGDSMVDSIASLMLLPLPLLLLARSSSSAFTCSGGSSDGDDGESAVLFCRLSSICI